MFSQLSFQAVGTLEFSIYHYLVPRTVKTHGVYDAVRRLQMASVPVQFCSISTADPERALRGGQCGGVLW